MTRLYALAATLGALALAAAPAAAAPGRYTQYLVSMPDGTPTPAGPWASTDGGWSSGTLSGGPLEMVLPTGVGDGWSRSATLARPPGLTFASAWVDRAFDAPAGTAIYQPQIFTSWEYRGDVDAIPGYTGESGDGALTINNPSTLSVTVRCSQTIGGSDPDPRCVPDSWWRMRRLELTIGDTTAPTAALDGTGGALLDGTWQTLGSEVAAVRGADTGAGVYRFFLRDGATTTYALADPASATCRDARPGIGSAYEFTATTTSLVPCGTGDRAYAPEFSLAALGDGVHPGLTLGVEDAGGRETVIDPALTLRVNAPGGTLADPGTACANGVHDESGTCIARAPANTITPTLTGTPTTFGALSTDTGTWNDVVGATYAYAWELCDVAGLACVPIAGENGSTLTLTVAMADHTVRSVVSATTNGGTVVARSAPSYAIAGTGLGGGAGGAGGLRDVIAQAATGGGVGGGAAVRLTEDELPTPTVLLVHRVNGRNGESTARVAAALRADSIAGRLTTATGEPIADAQLDVMVHAAVRGAKGEIAGAVQTDDDGRFTFRPPPGGARIFTFGYREHLSDATYVHWASVPIAAATTSPTLTIDRTRVTNGQSVLFRGTASTDVELQVQVGSRWKTIATPRLRNGAFSHRYRFTRTLQSQTYRFRTLTQSGPSTTQSVRVTAKEAR